MAVMTTTWVCIDCGARQPNDGTCAACGHDPTLDLSDERTREFMRDVELRLKLRREGRFRFAGVVVGMAVIFGLWTQSFYWAARGRIYPGLPFFADQWIFMVLIGFCVAKVLEKSMGKLRVPYLRDDLTME